MVGVIGTPPEYKKLGRPSKTDEIKNSLDKLKKIKNVSNKRD